MFEYPPAPQNNDGAVPPTIPSPPCGKTVGNFEAISSSSACVSGDVVMMMSLPAIENWNSLTAFDVIVFVNFTAKLWLGWLQSDASVGYDESPQKLPVALRCVHFSLIYRTIRFIL